MAPHSPLRIVFLLVCAAALLVGLLLAISPWLADGGFLGWFFKLEDMQESDVPLLQLLQQLFMWATRIGLGLISAAIGIAIMIVAGVVAIATGLVASLVRLGKAAQDQEAAGKT